MTDREEFEAWVSESGWNLERNAEGNYCTSTTDAAWGGWQAASAAALERAAEVCETILDELSFANAYECSNECAAAIRALKEQK